MQHQEKKLSEVYSTELAKSGFCWPIVLDTNVVLDLLLYDDGAVAALRDAHASGRIALLTDAACMAEVEDVLGRHTLHRDAAMREKALRGYRAMAVVVPIGAGPANTALPLCRDESDQKFLHLASRAGARLLVTRDRALLELANRVAHIAAFRVVDPAGASQWLATRSASNA